MAWFTKSEEENESLREEAFTEALRSIIAQIGKELLNLREVLNEMAIVKPKDDVIARRAKGSILHDFYNCCERIFQKIAVELNSGYEESEKWHPVGTRNSRTSSPPLFDPA